MGGEPQPGALSQLPIESGNGGGDANGISFRRFFTSRKGNVFDAHDYGHEAWPIGAGR